MEQNPKGAGDVQQHHCPAELRAGTATSLCSFSPNLPKATEKQRNPNFREIKRRCVGVQGTLDGHRTQ